MEIIRVNDSNLKEVVIFLESLHIIKDINEDVVLNGEYLYDEEIVGFISYENFKKIGMIRYFILRKKIDEEIINEMFRKVCIKAKDDGLESLITLVVREEAVEIFEELGFLEINNKNMYIDEININDTRFKNAIVLRYSLL